LVFQLIQDVDVTKWIENATHQARLAHSSLYRIEARPNGAFGTYDPGY
jgi:hypothetical protein